MSRSFLMACVQLHGTNQLQHNLERCRHWIKEAAERGAELIMLPEDFAFLAQNEQEKQQLSDSDLKRIIETIREEALRHSAYVLAGGYPVKVQGEERFYNTATLFSRTGEELGHYQKAHLFDADPPGAKPIRESKHYKAGSSLTVVDTPLCKIGLSICYDLRFPELYRSLALSGADLITVPAAFTLTTGKDHWRVLLQARAIENQCYIAAPAQWGRHSDARHSFGSSLICDPWGTVTSCASEGEGLAFAEYNPQKILSAREKVPCRSHLRHDLFPFLSEAKGD